jgi:hypothetical protein
MWGAHKAGGEAVERIGLPLYQIRVLSLEDAASPLTSCKLREYMLYLPIIAANQNHGSQDLLATAEERSKHRIQSMR